MQLQTPLASQRILTVLLLGLQSLALSQAHFPRTHRLFRCMPQLLPQPPQFVVFAVTSVSQPLSTPVVGFEQLPNPGSQNDEHALPVHASVVTRVDEHVRLQPPQFARSS